MWSCLAGQTLGEVYAHSSGPDRSPSNKTIAWKAGSSLNPSLNPTSMRRSVHKAMHIQLLTSCVSTVGGLLAVSAVLDL